MTGSFVTVITSINPATVNKRYILAPDGQLQKTAVANITEGVAQCHEVTDVDAMAALLRQVTQSSNQVICPGRWHGCDGSPFHIFSERALAEMLGKPVGSPELAGVHEHDGRRVAARLKRGIYPSWWLLLDADSPPGMPTAWAAMSIQERAEFLEPILPGLSKCERIELRGSSSRVHCVDEEPGPATHAWIRVDDPSAIERLRTYLSVAMVNKDLSFGYERHSRLDPSMVVGIEARTVFDLAVFVCGRLVFCAQPYVEPDGYTVADAGVKVVNRGGGPLRIAHLTLPSDRDLGAYRERTGQKLEVKDGGRGLGVGVKSYDQLKLETEITVRGVTKPLADWLKEMGAGEKKRCEAPYRESQSEAAFIHKNGDGSAFVHDVGNGVTYILGKSTTGRQRSSTSAVTLKPVSEYRMENYRWLWPGWLARGKQIVLAGPPGVAKTTLALSMAATISKGGQWPDGTRAPKGSVVIWSGEDSIADTLKPRLAAMGADMDSIYIVHSVNDQECGPRPFSPATDMEKLGPALEAVNPALLILDPVSSAITGDSHKAAEVRRDLQPLVDLAEKLDFAVLGITHFTKGSQGRNPIERVMGSVALAAGARLVMVAVKPADEGEMNRLARAKSNIGPDGGGFEYSLEQTFVRDMESDVDVSAQKISWGQELEGPARELLSVEEPDTKDEEDAMTKAAKVLTEMLARGPVQVRTIREITKSQKIAWRTVERAKKQLSLKATKSGLYGGWQWELSPE